LYKGTGLIIGDMVGVTWQDGESRLSVRRSVVREDQVLNGDHLLVPPEDSFNKRIALR
jgi:hypothetical protein